MEFEIEKPKPKSRWAWKLFFFLLLLPAILISLYTWATLSFVYATGERAGYLQKFSKRGWIFKTWEGELAMINLPGATTEKFFFSARKKEVAKKIEAHLGQRVSLVYEQHKGIPVKWFGETQYFATDVKAVSEITQAVPTTPK